MLNLDGSGGGYARVEFLEADKRPIAGFSGDDAAMNMGNGIRLPVRMKGDRTDLSALMGREVRLRFTGHAVKLYSFQFRND